MEKAHAPSGPLRCVSVLATVLVFGCGGDGESGTDGGPLTDASGGSMDASVPADGGGDGVDGGGVVVLDGGAVLLPDGNVLPAGPITCQGHLYACGDEIDNDGDGLIDDRDPDCLGPCDNNEQGFSLQIPGGDSAPCRLDCYFDQDQGSGNDTCQWDHRCDPLEPDRDPRCMFSDPPPASANCPETQDETCEEICAPLVPNGCDCFGCCNLPAGGDRWVFIGTVDPSTGEATCDLDSVEDDEACRPCTPVDNCLNPCGECELCLGRTELPPGCLPSPPVDAGTLPDGGVAPPPDAEVPPPICDDGRQPCGFTGAEPCPTGAFCLTGCCTVFG